MSLMSLNAVFKFFCSVLAIMLWHLFMWWNHLLELCRYSRLGNWASRLHVLITCTWPTSPLLTRCLILLIAGSNLLRKRISHVHLLSKSYIYKLQVHIINISTLSVRLMICKWTSHTVISVAYTLQKCICIWF